jgi:hypothetical protein
MKPARYQKANENPFPKEEELLRMNYNDINKLLDRFLQIEDEDGYVTKTNQVERIQIIDLDFKGKDKRPNR